MTAKLSDQESADNSDYSEPSDSESEDEDAQQAQNPQIQQWVRVYPSRQLTTQLTSFLKIQGPSTCQLGMIY